MSAPPNAAVSAHSADYAGPIDATIDRAMKLQMAGDAERAERLYRAILEARPRHALASHCLGMLKLQLNRPTEGLPFLFVALEAEPANLDFWLGYLEALLAAGQFLAARQALEIGKQRGLAGAAIDDFAHRLASAAVAAPVERLPDALPAPARPAAIRSDAAAAGESNSRPGKAQRRQNPEAQRLEALIAQERLPEAIALARRMTRRDPGDGLSWKRLGALLWWQKRGKEAEGPMRKSVRLLPNDAEAHSNLGLVLLYQKRRNEALRCIVRALELDPRRAAAHYHLGMLHLVEQRMAMAETSLRAAVELEPAYLTDEVKPVHSDLLFVCAHNPDADPRVLFDEHRRFGELLEPALCADRLPHSNLANPDRCLKVGFVSGDLRDHSVGMFLEWVLGPLSQSSGLELHAYATGSGEDAVTQRLKLGFRHWNAAVGLSDIALAQRIQQDSIDILVDLSGHTAENRLRTFARKPAPVQMSWLGYPGTTGLSAMDYYLADRQWLPPERFAHLFTEKLIYMPDRWAFGVHPDAPPVGPLPALDTGHLTFGSFHRFGKISNSTLSLWARLLHALPDSRLLVAALLDGQQAALAERFAAQGIGPERLIFHGRLAMDAYLGLHNQVDIALDAHPYGGGTTTMHSLSMGVPTLAMSGATSFANACAGILHNAGLTQFVALDDRDFIDQARAWSTRLPELAALRAGMRQRLAAAPAGRPGFIAAHLEAAFRQAWRRWCNHLPPVSFDSAPPSAEVAPPFHECVPAASEPQSDEQTLLALVGRRRYAEAREHARALTQASPDNGVGWKFLGAMLWVEQRAEEALAAMRESARLMPQDAETLSNLGSALGKMRHFEEAELWLNRAIAVNPAFADSYYRLCMTYELQGRYLEAESAIRRGVALIEGRPNAEEQRALSSLLYLMGYNPDVDQASLFREHRRYAAMVEDPLRSGWRGHTNPRDPGRRLRIGILSGDFHDHPVAHFLEPLAAQLAQATSLELIAYWNNTRADWMTARLQQQFKSWHAVSTITDDALAQRIRDDGIDILIDLAGHTGRNRLPVMAHKPAPVQVSWLGYPATTGLESVDYYLADAHWLPPGRFERAFSEKLVYLPDRWVFRTHPLAPLVGPLPALKTGRPTFGSFHRIGKLNDSTVHLWSTLLARIPDSRLFLVGVPLDGAAKSLIDRFAACGVSPDRLTVYDRCPLDAYLALHNEVDIALDSHPYSGATTTMHSLSMGVPVLTIDGATSTARACAGILGHLGLEAFIAADATDFLEKAVGWCGRLSELAALRTELRARLERSPAGDPSLIAAHLDAALRHMWRHWCDGLPSESFHSSLTQAQRHSDGAASAGA